MTITINDRIYNKPKKSSNPLVVVCIDGSEPGYIEEAIKTNHAPFFANAMKNGTNFKAKCVVPSFTNPNNMSIVTGRPPEIHGICGNFYYDKENDVEIMMNDPSLLYVPTIFKSFQDAGYKIAVITAKDKLRALLCDGLTMSEGNICGFSAEKSDQCSIENNGIDNIIAMTGMALPNVYSAELSEMIFNAGVKIMARDRPDLMYLSTTDYIQHKHAEGTKSANDFYIMMDRYLTELDAMGCVIIITADHGMNDKYNEDGSPNVIYLQDVLDDKYDAGTTRVICPITDPYVVHHGALGSYVTVYLSGEVDVNEILARIKSIDGIDDVLTAKQASVKFQLPIDRIGDLVIVAAKNKVIGTTISRHDLSGLKQPLRSHGGVSEQNIPMLSNKKCDLANDDGLRNFDAFFIGLNHMID